MREVETRISSSETMMDGGLERYLGVGKSAMNAIAGIVGPDFEPVTVLDLPSGHGRVARHLKAAYPQAELFVSDLDQQGADFCGRTFGAKVLASRPDFDEVSFGQTFDLIWVGSLITHLPEEATKAFLRFIARHVSEGGVAVVTSHGAFVAGRLFGRERGLYGMTAEQERPIFQDYIRTGYGYRNYPAQHNYGISLISRDWIKANAREAGLVVASYTDHAWDMHQDVIELRLS